MSDSLITDRSVSDKSITGQSIADQSIADQSIADKLIADKAFGIDGNAVLPAQWTVNDIAINTATYLKTHDQFMPKIDLIYQTDGVPTELAITKQMTVLGKALDGRLSWISHFDSDKHQAYIDILGFRPNVADAAKGTVTTSVAAGGDGQSKSNDDAVSGNVNTIKLIQMDESARAVCNQNRLIDFTELMHLSAMPDSWVDAQRIRANFILGLPADTNYTDYAAASSAKNHQEEEHPLTSAERQKENAVEDRWEFRMPMDASQEDVEAAQTKYTAMLKACN